MVTGSCLCGGVQFHIDGELAPIQVCHCQQCRKAQGTPFVTNMPVLVSEFHLDSGAGLLTAYESSPGKQRLFCSRCGSPVYSQNMKTPGVLRIRAGTLNEPLSVRPAVHFYTGSQCNWWPISDDLPQYPGAYLPRESGKA
jgi:hypothetical protein